MLGKLWSALPLEEKEKYERKVEKQRVDQEKQRIDNERQELDNVKIVAKSKNAAEKSVGKKSEDWGNSEKLSQLAEVPDPYLIFSSEVRGEVVKRNPTLSSEKVLSINIFLPHKILVLVLKGGGCSGRDVEDDGAKLQGNLLQVGLA